MAKSRQKPETVFGLGAATVSGEEIGAMMPLLNLLSRLLSLPMIVAIFQKSPPNPLTPLRRCLSGKYSEGMS